jgi:lipopolysaccharide export system permease protein
MKSSSYKVSKDIHMQIEPGVYIYMKHYRPKNQKGYKFSMEKFDKGRLESKLMADYVKWDTTTKKWTVHDYYIRNIDSGYKDSIQRGQKIDTSLSMNPSDLAQRTDIVETMGMEELNQFIKKRRMQGAENLEAYLVEKYRRFSYPFSTFILTFIGVVLSSRKIRGGMGMQIGIGITLSFAYILFMRFATMYALRGGIDPLIAVWIPNIIFAIVAIPLYRYAPK